MLNLVKYHLRLRSDVLYSISEKTNTSLQKKKCNSSMTMHAILNVLRIVLLNIVYNGTMRFIYQHEY